MRIRFDMFSVAYSILIGSILLYFNITIISKNRTICVYCSDADLPSSIRITLFTTTMWKKSLLNIPAAVGILINSYQILIRFYIPGNFFKIKFILKLHRIITERMNEKTYLNSTIISRRFYRSTIIYKKKWTWFIIWNSFRKLWPISWSIKHACRYRNECAENVIKLIVFGLDLIA